jgi:hypothetical protein
VNACQYGFRSAASFGFGGQESASKPPQAICKTLVTTENCLTTFERKGTTKSYLKPKDSIKLDGGFFSSSEQVYQLSLQTCIL